MLFFLSVLLGIMLTANEPDPIERSPAAVSSIATPVRELRVGPLVSDSAGKSASLIGVSYEKSPEGYRPILVVWELGPQGKKRGEFNYELPVLPEKYPGYPFSAACRWGNGDIAVITLFTGHQQLTRLNHRGEVVYALEASSGSERFIAIAPENEGGLWVGGRFGDLARLFHLDSKGTPLLTQDYAFDDYTVISKLAQPKALNGVLACGTAKRSEGIWQEWVARISAEGEVLKKVSIPGTGPLEAMAALPNGGVAVLQISGDRDQRTITIWVFDADLNILGSGVWTGPTVEALHFSMTFVGDELLVLVQGRWQHYLMRVDGTGQIKARQPIATGMVAFPRLSLAAVDGKFLIAGRSREGDGAVRMTDLQIEAYETVRRKDDR